MPEEVVASIISRIRLADHKAACALCYLNGRPCITARDLAERVRVTDLALAPAQ